MDFQAKYGREGGDMRTQRWLEELFACIDGRQTHAFVAFLREDALFRYGSNPDVNGRAAIATCVDQVFATFRASTLRCGRSRRPPG